MLLMGSTVQAFTNGTLLPSYLCANAGDGLPKSVGGMVANLVLGWGTNPYNDFPVGNGSVNIVVGPVNTYKNGVLQLTANIAQAPPASQILGSFHNGQAATNYLTVTTNPVVIVPDVINVTSGMLPAGWVVTPGATITMAVVTNAPSFNNMDNVIDGFFVYAMDTATGNRIGEFTETTAKFHSWAACNVDGTTPNVGIAHTDLVEESGYVGLKWKAPNKIVGTVKFIGAGVADGGYGPVAIEFNTTTNHTAPALTTVVRMDVANSNGAFTVAAAATTTTAAATTTTTVSPGATAGIAIGTAVLGAAIGVGAAVFYVRSKKW